MTLYDFSFAPTAVLAGGLYWGIAWLLTRGPLFPIAIESACLWLWRSVPLFWKSPVDIVYKALSCHKCTTFWLILFATANPLIALFWATLTDRLDR